MDHRHSWQDFDSRYMEKSKIVWLRRQLLKLDLRLQEDSMFLWPKYMMEAIWSSTSTATMTNSKLPYLALVSFLWFLVSFLPGTGGSEFWVRKEHWKCLDVISYISLQTEDTVTMFQFLTKIQSQCLHLLVELTSVLQMTRHYWSTSPTPLSRCLWTTSRELSVF